VRHLSRAHTRTLLACAALVLTAFARDASAQVTSPYPGVTVVQEPGSSLAIVNLCAPGIGVRATRFEEREATAPEWAARSGVGLATNGDYFDYGSYYVVHRGSPISISSTEHRRPARPTSSAARTR
jgi:hypothetical protein